MHSLLARQIKRLITSPEDLPEKVHKLLAVVDAAYEQADEDRRMVERSLEIMSRELGQRNSQLLERSGALAAANEELQAFSYSVSHDLRAPLRAMDGFCRILLEDYGQSLDETGQHYLQRIQAGSQRMSELIEGLLTLSRLSRTEIALEPVDLSQIATAIAGALAESEPQREVAIEVEAGVTAVCDERLMQVVLDNLLRNAWKFTAKHKTAHIQFGIRQVEGERAFFVRDDGAGFDMT